MSEHTESTFVKHVPCDKCGSSDANSLFTDGHTFCFACNTYGKGDGEDHESAPVRKKASGLISDGRFHALSARGITVETCRKYNYQIGTYRDEKVHIANYTGSDGAVVAQKVRTANKDFVFLGEPGGAQFFGQHLFGSGGRKLIVTEGEIDCLTVSQLQGNKFPVVSVPTGASGAARTFRKQAEFLNKFEQIILMFDDDDAGRAAVAEVAPLIPVGRCFIATVPGYKDANEALQAGAGELVISAVWNAKEYRPDGIVSIKDLRERLAKEPEQGLPYWDDRLTKATYGRRYSEIVGIGAGTGVGKTDWITMQVSYDLTVLKEKVGLVFLEQDPKETCERLAGKLDGVRYHVPEDGNCREKMLETLDQLDERLFMYDSFGATEWEVVAGKIRFMAQSLGIRIFYIDHLTALADTAREKESLEQLTKELAGLAKELNIWVMFVSHLATPEGKPHEEGGRVAIRHFKGSRAIGFWSYFMFGLERNQQAEDEAERSITTFRILKDRFTGQATGKTLHLGYDQTTGRQFPVSEPPKHKESNDYGF